jgi:hypothetical protein
MWTGFVWVRIGPNEHDNKPSGSITGGEFLEELSDYQQKSVTVHFYFLGPNAFCASMLHILY